MSTAVPSLPSMKRDMSKAHVARSANAQLRKAIAAQELLESLGCKVTWPPTPHETIAAATIKR